jgi:hypothetical protein
MCNHFLSLSVSLSFHATTKAFSQQILIAPAPPFRDPSVFGRGKTRVTGTPVEVERDGECLHHSLACGLRVPGGQVPDDVDWQKSTRDAAALRKLVCSTLRESPAALVDDDNPSLGTAWHL